MFNLKLKMLTVCAKGGGGGSGKVDYPDYMTNTHSDWLELLEDDIVAARAATSPYSTATAYDPDTAIAAMLTALSGFNTLVTGLDSFSDVYDLVSSKIGSLNTEVSNKVSDYAEEAEYELTTNILPQFKRGMQTVNASAASAFVIGEALLRSTNTRDVNKFRSAMELDYAIKRKELILAGAKEYAVVTNLNAEFYKILVHYTTEVNRIRILASKEEIETNLEYDVKDALWDLSLYREGANMLAAIGGGTTAVEQQGPSKAQSAIGGALSGAGTGAMIGAQVGTGGGPIGAAVGGLVGLAGGLFL
jgi:hypothetical protein